jgi:hypothetical protein
VALGDAAEISEGLAYIAKSQVDVARALGIRIGHDLRGTAECKHDAP